MVPIAEQIGQEAREIVLKLIDDGFVVDRIVRYTGLTPNQVRRLQSNNAR